jgi:glycosyltransferase involved in cell wall biosynthesis
MKIKTLEAVQHGLPVVTTREGARGMMAANGRSLRVADSRGAFVGHLRHLLSDEAARRAARQACREDAATLFSPQAAMAELNMALGAALG